MTKRKVTVRKQVLAIAAAHGITVGSTIYTVRGGITPINPTGEYTVLSVIPHRTLKRSRQPYDVIIQATINNETYTFRYAGEYVFASHLDALNCTCAGNE